MVDASSQDRQRYSTFLLDLSRLPTDGTICLMWQPTSRPGKPNSRPMATSGLPRSATGARRPATAWYDHLSIELLSAEAILHENSALHQPEL